MDDVGQQLVWALFSLQNCAGLIVGSSWLSMDYFGQHIAGVRGGRHDGSSTADACQARHNAIVVPMTSELISNCDKTRQTQTKLGVLRENCSQSDQTGKHFS